MGAAGASLGALSTRFWACRVVSCRIHGGAWGRDRTQPERGARPWLTEMRETRVRHHGDARDRTPSLPHPGWVDPYPIAWHSATGRTRTVGLVNCRAIDETRDIVPYSRQT